MSLAPVTLDELRWLIDRIIHRHLLREGGSSPFGTQLEVLRNAWPGQTRGPSAAERAGLNWARKSRAEAIDGEFAWLCALAKLWTPDEESVLREKHTPATPRELWARTPPELAERERWVCRGDLRTEIMPDGTSHYRTAAGEVPVYECRGIDVCQRGDCWHYDNRVLVRGPCAKFPTDAEIALRMGRTRDWVRARVGSAYDKLREDLIERAMQGKTATVGERGST